jgi:hypothetical protein
METAPYELVDVCIADDPPKTPPIKTLGVEVPADLM